MRVTDRNRFGLLVYSSSNLGDEIQSLAALRHLPRVDEIVDRDEPHQLPHTTRVICNGWFTHRPDLWPPSNRNIEPLLTSIHLANDGDSSHARLLAPKGREYLSKHGPVGCRDTATLDLLVANDIPAYFSGCLTLTLPPYSGHRHDRVVFVDVPDEITQQAPPDVRGTGLRLKQSTGSVRGLSLSGRFRLRGVHQFAAALRRLRIYATSRLVITTRLHAALPAIALGTPSILLMRDPSDPRFQGLSQFTHALPLDDVSADPRGLDWTLNKAPTEHLALAEHLTATAREFIERDCVDRSPANGMDTRKR